jgi:acetolactate synthase small subunit
MFAHLLNVYLLYAAQVPVWAVLDYTETRTITRELLLVKVSILGPEYLEDQLAGGPSHDPRVASGATSSKTERERTLAHHFEHSANPDPSSEPHTAITPSQALRLKHQHLHSISVLATQFGAKIVDVSEHSVIVELTAKTARVEAFLSLVKPFGILEAARTGQSYYYHSGVSDIDNLIGLMAMPRTPITTSGEEDEVASDLDGAVDASLLPPG